MSAPVRQFGRVCELVVGDNAAGLGVKISKLRIKFEIKKTLHRTPNAAEILVYNANQDTENQIRNEFDEVLVNIGYEGATRLVLRGNLRRARAYSEDTDRIVQIIAGDGDRDFREGHVNFTLGAGSGHAEVVDHIVSKAFRSTKKGHIVTSSAKRIRGRVFAGMARDVLDDIALEGDAHWSIQDGTLHMVPVDSTLPSEAVKVTYETGLLEPPEIDEKGVHFKCLLNPELLPNGKAWLDNEVLKERVRQTVVKTPTASGHTHSKPTKKKGIARVDPDGVYKIVDVTHKGDTHGQDWRSEVTCVALSKSIPSGKTAA